MAIVRSTSERRRLLPPAHPPGPLGRHQDTAGSTWGATDRASATPWGAESSDASEVLDRLARVTAALATAGTPAV
ncbi:MAG TPA: hypothetical protein VMF60_01975, partial [Acidimicrobiales bacterium]|nr:hypothetical protein [Acidimicrobiales bacterium]